MGTGCWAAAACPMSSRPAVTMLMLRFDRMFVLPSTEQKREDGFVVLPVRDATRTRTSLRGFHQDVAHALWRPRLRDVADRPVQDVDGWRPILFERLGDAVADDDAEVARLDRDHFRFVRRLREQPDRRTAAHEHAA